MTKKSILDTELIQNTPNNTGILSKTNTKKDNKTGLNPLVTILNKDFNKQLINDYNNQKQLDKQIINKEYIEKNQPDIIRLYKKYYPDNYEEKLKGILVDLEKEKHHVRLDFFHVGLDDITRSIPITLDDIKAYLNRGGFKDYVFSLQARPEILVYDLDMELTPKETEKIKEEFKGYIYLMEVNSDNGHSHIYLQGDKESSIHYNKSNKDKIFIPYDDKTEGIEIYKNYGKNVACSTPSNNYEIILDEKPTKTITLEESITLFSKAIGVDIDTTAMNNVLHKNTPADNNPTTQETNTAYFSESIQYNPIPATDGNITEIIENATPLLNKKGSRNTLYLSLVGAMIRTGYPRETIEEIVKITSKKNHDGSRLSEVKSVFKRLNEGGTIYGWNNFEETITGLDPTKQELDNLNNLQQALSTHYNSNRYNHNGKSDEEINNEILKVLAKINEETKISSKIKKQLISLLEQKLNLFGVDIEDNKLKSGYRRKYYKINDDSNTYQEINRSWLQRHLTNEYGDVKLYETSQFYESMLDRINTLKESNPNYLELENVYIDKRNYNIIDKKELPEVFTEDRLYYEDYNTNELRLFHYDKNINLYDVMKGNIKPSLAMETFMKIFVPRTKPDDIKLLLYILQTIGMMVIGKNPAKRITVLYDEDNEKEKRTAGDSGKSTAREIIKEIFKNGNSDLNDKTLNDNFLINSIVQATHFLFMDELRGNELKQYIHIIKRLTSGYDYDGRKAYSDKQDSVTVPPILITMNGVPELSLHDKTYLKRYVLAKAPNVFKPSNEVDPEKNEYPQISNILEQIKKESEGLSQILSIAINEYITLNHEKSIKHQLALNPSIEETIGIVSRNDPVFGILTAYTKAGARTSNIDSWVSISELQDTIRQVYKTTYDKEINPDLITNQTIGYKLVEVYPELLGGESQKHNKKRYGSHNVYNITLFTTEEIEHQLSEIIEYIPNTEKQILDGVSKAIHNKVRDGVDTEKKIYNEFSEVYDESEITYALEQLEKFNLIKRTGHLDFME